MIIHTYVSTYNDLSMIQHYVRHYEKFAQKIFVYDDDSTDGTREFLKTKEPLVQIMNPGFHGLDELKLQHMRSTEYRIHSRGVADWVIIGDSDEFHYHEHICSVLYHLKSAGYGLVRSQGWQMLSDCLPEQDAYLPDVVKYGVRDQMYDRYIFDPAYDVEIAIGHHGISVLKKSARSAYWTMDERFKMLHFKFLGRQYVINRHAKTVSRTPESSKQNGWGIHATPDWKGVYSLAWYENALKEKVRCLD